MNALPDSRKALYGRTHHRIWAASDFDPIERYPRPSVIRSVALAVLIGLALAFLIAWEFAS